MKQEFIELTDDHEKLKADLMAQEGMSTFQSHVKVQMFEGF